MLQYNWKTDCNCKEFYKQIMQNNVKWSQILIIKEVCRIDTYNLFQITIFHTNISYEIFFIYPSVHMQRQSEIIKI